MDLVAWYSTKQLGFILIGGLFLAGCGGSSPPAEPASTVEQAPQSSASAVVTGKVPAGGAGGAALVMLQPANAAEMSPPAEQAVMDQLGQEFIPELLVVRSGQTVRFQSSEDVLHNVRVVESATKEGIFNIATPAFGFYNHTFERPGFYTVTCDIHPTMRADILVTTTPHYAIADAQGGFSIQNVPTGAYTLTVLRGTEKTEKAIDVVAPRTELDVSGGN